MGGGRAELQLHVERGQLFQLGGSGPEPLNAAFSRLQQGVLGGGGKEELLLGDVRADLGVLFAVAAGAGGGGCGNRQAAAGVTLTSGTSCHIVVGLVTAKGAFE